MNTENIFDSQKLEAAPKSSAFVVSSNSFNISTSVDHAKKSTGDCLTSHREDGSGFTVSSNNNNNTNNTNNNNSGISSWNPIIGNCTTSDFGGQPVNVKSDERERDTAPTDFSEFPGWSYNTYTHQDWSSLVTQESDGKQETISDPTRPDQRHVAQAPFMPLTQGKPIPLIQYSTLAINSGNFPHIFNASKCDMSSMNNNVSSFNNENRINTHSNLTNSSDIVGLASNTMPYAVTQQSQGEGLQDCPWVDEITSPEDTFLMSSGVMSPPVIVPNTGLHMGLVNMYNTTIPMINTANYYTGHATSMDHVPHSPFFASLCSEPSSSVSQVIDGLPSNGYMPTHHNAHSFFHEEVLSPMFLKSPREKEEEPTQFTPYPQTNYRQRSNSSSVPNVNGGVAQYQQSPSEGYPSAYDIGLGQQMQMHQQFGSGRWRKGVQGTVLGPMYPTGPWLTPGVIAPYPQLQIGTTAAIPQTSAKSQFVEKFHEEHVQKNWALHNIEGHIVEIAKDQEGSRFIQTLLDYAAENGTLDEVIDYIIKELFVDEKVAHDVISDVFGNYVVQKIFDMANVTQMNTMIRCIIPCLIKLTLQTYGCRVIQKVVEVTGMYSQKGFAESQVLMDMIIREVKNHVSVCVQDQNGNHVIQKCVEVIPAKSGFIIDYFKGKVRELATHAYGCRVLQCILQNCKSDEPWIMKEIFVCLPELSMDQYGNYVVQHVIQHGSKRYINTVFDLMKHKIYQCSKHKFASNVMEKLYVKASKSQKEELFNILSQPDNESTCPEQLMRRIEGKPLLSYFVLMMMNSYANYVVQKIVDESSEAIRQKMMNHIKQFLDVLKNHHFGKHIIARFERSRYLPAGAVYCAGVNTVQFNGGGSLHNNNGKGEWQGGHKTH